MYIFQRYPIICHNCIYGLFDDSYSSEYSSSDETNCYALVFLDLGYLLELLPNQLGWENKKLTTPRITQQDWRPNLFKAGFAKWGTTELCDYLSQHPDIFLPYEKEPHMFYDLAKISCVFSGDYTDNRGNRIFSVNDYYKLSSKEKNTNIELMALSLILLIQNFQAYWNHFLKMLR